jgi:hypothetical protein
LRLEGLGAGPHLVWLQLEGRTPKVLRVSLPREKQMVVLEPLPPEHRAAPLIEALTRASGPERRDLSRALAGALGVDEVVLAQPGVAGLGLAALVELSPAPSHAKGEGAHPWLRRSGWGLLATAVGLCAGAVYAGLESRAQSRSAANAHYASDGSQLAAQAEQLAHTANWLYAGSSATLLAGGGVLLVF